ncbi:hypothetical protein F53441_9541 [Fusarium austroafricanum]|uniref:Uncharacterized protein n=1 Tax=Fusarium austroafricanum TaxID=2364996 RepID=A0A8H4P3A1_9HYPO|nr:hypothetical protein F53441_9541 [Fusarium austroafricanum]
MVKRFDGIEFWERRCRALELSQISGSDSASDSSSESDTDASLLLVETSEIDSPELDSPEKTSEPTWPRTAKTPEDLIRSQPIVIQTVSAVHNVRNSLSTSPLLDHRSQSASVQLSNSYEEKEEFLTVVKRNDSGSPNALGIDNRRSQSGPSNITTLRRRTPLKLETTNLTIKTRRQQRHSTLPNLPISSHNSTPLDHKHTFSASAECNKCLTRQTDKAYEALAEALKDKRRDSTRMTIIRPTIDCRMPSLKSPKPIRPKIIPQHLEKAQQWAESQEDLDSSTVSSMSSPMSPMMPISMSLDGKTPPKIEIPPMGCNLDHDLGDFLKWEARHVCAYGYGTNGFSLSP